MYLTGWRRVAAMVASSILERSRQLNRICCSHGLGKSEAKITDPFVREGAYLKIFYQGLL